MIGNFAQRLLEFGRRRASDEAKAREYVVSQASSVFREIMGDYDAFATHLADVPDPAFQIGTAKDSTGREVTVRLEEEEFFTHQLIQGSTGSGKTSCAIGLVSQAMRTGLPVGVLDCKSGFYDLALSWAGAVAYELPEPQRLEFIKRLVVINPFSDDLVPFNVCHVMAGTSPEVQAFDVSLVLSGLFDAQMGFQMENILRHLLLLLMEFKLTLVEAPEILQNELLRGILVERCQNLEVKEYFSRTFRGVPSASKDAILSRIQALLLPENLRLMLGADDMLNFRAILDRGDLLFIFLGKGPGVPEEQVEMFGSLLLQALFQGVYAGGSTKRRPFQLVCDEFFHLLEAPKLAKRFETGLTTLRSFGVTLSLVMHQFGQIPPPLREAILGNCDVLALFRMHGRNALNFGDFLPDLDPEIVERALAKTGKPPHKMEVRSQLIERLQRLPARHCYWYDRRRPYRAILVRVPDVAQPHEAAGLTEKELDTFIETHGIRRGQAALPKAVLREQIERRKKWLASLLSPVAELKTTTQVKAPPQPPKEKAKGPRLGS